MPAFTLGPDDPVGALANRLLRSLVAGRLRFAPRVGLGVLDVRDFAAGMLLAAAARPAGADRPEPGAKPLYAAMYDGPLLTSVPSAVPGADGIYLADLSLGGPGRGHPGLVRLPWPDQLR